MIRRLLIANRGEIAIRIARACRELGVESVAVYSAADAGAPHVRAADRAVAIGASPAAESYLAIDRVIEAARAAEADAVHPGYGFLSENAAFADACARAGLIFVGPPASVIARMGSKIQARRLVSAAGVPVVPGETPADQSDAGVQQAVERVGLPALIKASAGGGGKGMRRVREPGETLEAIQAARREAAAAFGDGTLYVERLVEMPHHVEVQIFAGSDGQIVHLFERECSVQRRHQKVIEESPSPILSSELRDRIAAAAVAAAAAAEYRNAGTIEFLVDTSRRRQGPADRDTPFYFLEMNTRLQVEHPVTEQVVGVDLVRAQLLVASGEPLPWPQERLAQRGHAIEARVYAEDPSHGFIPQAGVLAAYREPRWPGVRIDSGVEEGTEITVHYDPMIAKVIATAESRPLAISRLSAALHAFTIGGVRTNIPFLIRVLALDAFRDGTIDTAYLDRDGAHLAASVRTDETALHVTAPPPAANAAAAPSSAAAFDPWNAEPVASATRRQGQRAQTSVRRTKTARSGAGVLVAPMPATVLSVKAKAGDTVRKNDVVILLEAMKMELPLRAPADGVVSAVHCAEGDLVQEDATLVEFADASPS
jgi:acetyl/propionyl-CoA carboxylase alpha subunit